MNITREIAKRTVETSFQDLQGGDVEYSKTLAMSALGAMIAGPYCPGGDIITRYVKRAGGTKEATVPGAGFKAPVEMAALASGTYAHATEYEDDSFPEAVSSYTLFPAILALAEHLGSSGKEVIESFVLGYEAQARIGLACRPARKQGYMVLSLAGSIGCAVSAAKLLGLNASQTANAISIAASQASGIGYQTGTMAHIIEMGFSPRNGLTAALLANDGFTGKQDVLEAPRGLFNMITCGQVSEPERILLDWGKPYRINEVGIKFYPCCYHLQRLIETTLEVKQEMGLAADDIEEIVVHVNAFFPTVVQHPEPANEIEAQFSLPHVLAIAMLEERVIPAGFAMDKIKDPAFADFRTRVKTIVHEEWGWNPHGWVPEIIYRLRDEHEVVRRPERVRGQPPELLGFDECIPKYRGCVEGVLAEADIARSIDLLKDLEQCEDMGELMRTVAEASAKGVSAG
ncbi:2-methylcitrate dehydratase PrpD [Modicisalibacter muralis]|uniref:2-methylcitrate dehydratase PrpD n=1 Tax=Modicisalibacter muralis TaxID=119000 RepID=A0A1G9LN20_9GAMM|nr:MmgE/PrpD family protein [Halomonas muralis]SDL62895.1 2-methylcitrate dehydratase PrpD [Halomonas muralis]